MKSMLRNSLVTATLVTGVIVGGVIFSQTTESNRQVAIAATEVKIGAPAPNFTGTDSNGKKHSFADFKGKTVVLEWTNNDCPSVRKHYETKNMQKIQKSATSQGVIWLTIVSSAPGEQGFVNGEKKPTNLPNLVLLLLLPLSSILMARLDVPMELALPPTCL